MSSNLSFSVVTVNGLIDSFNPCAIGVLIATITVLFALGNYRRNIAIFGFFYVFTTYVTYLLIGLGLLKAMHLFGIHNFFAWVSSFFLIAMGMSQWKRSMCIIPKNMPKEATMLAGIVLGFLVGLCEFPCSGGVYMATIGFLGLQETFWSGLLLLMWYNLMFVLPLMILFALAYNMQAAKMIANIVGTHSDRIRKFSALSMISMGLLLLLWLFIR